MGACNRVNNTHPDTLAWPFHLRPVTECIAIQGHLKNLMLPVCLPHSILCSTCYFQKILCLQGNMFQACREIAHWPGYFCLWDHAALETHIGSSRNNQTDEPNFGLDSQNYESKPQWLPKQEYNRQHLYCIGYTHHYTILISGTSADKSKFLNVCCSEIWQIKPKCLQVRKIQAS